MAKAPEAPDLAAEQARITEDILAGVPLVITTAAVCHLVERCLPGTKVSIRTREPRTPLVGSGAGPSLSPAYRALFDPETGVFTEAQLRRLWTPGACMWSQDLAADPAWSPVRAEAAAEGLAACYTNPVLGADGQIQAIIYVYWPERHWPTVDDRRIVHLASVLMNVAVHHAHTEQALANAANHDPLTDLPNRTLFLDRLRQALARARRRQSGVAVLFLDLDRFKAINDSLGHAAGDRLLLAAAGRLSAAVRPGDTVARFGGDEFAVLCEEVDDVDVARSLGERLVEELTKPFVVAARRYFVTASIGVALGGAGSRPQDLLRDADVAMYRGKAQGRNRLEVFDRRLQVSFEQRLDDEARLRQDLDDDTLVLHYQPVFDLRTMSTIGIEALLRWRRPDGFEVDRRQLIAVAEEAGLVHRLGITVIDRACRQLRSLLDAGLVDRDFTVAANLSASQLTDLGLPDAVAGQLERHHLAPEQLVLEVTEASIGQHPEVATEALRRLRALGVGLWIDDFGTGYSSLTHLPELPVGGLKVDVPRLRTGDAGSPLLHVVADLARALDLPIIAEGVEDDAQIRQLRDLGVGAGQGWHLAPPAAPEDLPGVLAGRGRA